MDPKFEVAITGVGGFFPKSVDLEDFRELLMANASTAEPAKWVKGDIDENVPYSKTNNLIKNQNYYFDGYFFGVGVNQTLVMDPCTRMVLEKTFEAIIDAGSNPADLRGKRIAVVVGSSISETDYFLYGAFKSGFGVTGQARTMMANRVSYWLNLNGPSFSCESSWVSGVQVLQNAMDLIEKGHCEGAIVGATNFIYNESLCYLMKERGFTCKDGNTRAYDVNADGYSRSDGIVVLYLQRADLAKRNYATLLYANCIFNGNREGDFPECEEDGFANFLQDCYRNSGVDPNEVQYLEAHGSGVKKIDEIEMAAVERVLLKNRSTPLLVGSVKTNAGHAEPAAALFSVIKVLIAMEAGVIPAHINFTTSNPNITALTTGKAQIVTKNTKWDGGIAAINAFGVVSSFGHVLLKSNPRPKMSYTTHLPLLSTFSTRTEEGIEKMINTITSQPLDLEYNRLMQDVFSQNISGHLYRGYVLKATKDHSQFENFSGAKRPIWFAYSGMGSQWHTMGKDLMKLPIFAKAIQDCHNILLPKKIDLIKIITADDPDLFENILNSFVGIAAIQIGLTNILQAIGIVPDGLIGHSVGELGCAYADGCLTAEQMILSAYYRGQASLDADFIPGMMAAIGMGYNKLKKFCPEDIDIACHNGPESSTISGPVEPITKFVHILQSKGIFAKLVNVSNIAYHSQYIKPAAPYLLDYLKQVIKNPIQRSSKWISTSVPQEKWDTDLAKTVSPDYLTNNLLSSVLFEEGLPFIPSDAVVIEIAPHGLLQAILKRSLGPDVTNIALTKRNSNCLEVLFDSLGKLYVSGVDFNISPLYPPIAYPVSRGTRSLCKLVHWEHSEEYMFNVVDNSLSTTEQEFFINLNSKEYKSLSQHQVDGRIFVPPTLYLAFVNKLFRTISSSKKITFENVNFKHHVEFPEDGLVSVTVMVQKSSGEFEITHKNNMIVTGKIVVPENQQIVSSMPLANGNNVTVIAKNEFYKEMESRGYSYIDENKCISSVTVTPKGFVSTLTWIEDWDTYVNSLLQLHLFHTKETASNVVMLKYIESLHISFEQLMNSNEDSKVWYDNYTGLLISNNGIQIKGIDYVSLRKTESCINIEEEKLFNHFGEYFNDIQNGIDLCMKIVIADNTKQHKEFVITEFRDKRKMSLAPFVKNALEYQLLKYKMNIYEEFDSFYPADSSLVIINEGSTKHLPDVFKKTNNFLLICLPKWQCMHSNGNYVNVAKFENQDNIFYLLKKTKKFSIKIVNVNEASLTSDDVFKTTISWVRELKFNIKNDNNRIYLTSRVIPVEGINEFVHKMQSLPNTNNVRFLFLLDKNAPECSIQTEFYWPVFQQDLLVSVYSNGAWGSFVSVCESKVITENRSNEDIMAAVPSVLSNSCHVQYLGVHSRELSIDATKDGDLDSVSDKVGLLDYSGTTASGQRVMGIAGTDLDTLSVEPDPEFKWPVPEYMSLMDAATVPYAYTMAYYMLFELARVQRGEAVLVHAGTTAIGQAALHVAWNCGLQVYTTVATEKQRSILKKLLPQLQDCQIMSSENTNFEMELLWKTKGQGVQVVLNCLPGDRLHASKRCVSLFGRFVQLGTTDMIDHGTTSMNVFLRNVSFFSVASDSVVHQDAAVKKRIHEYILNGLNNGIVRPIARTSFTGRNIKDILRYLQSSEVSGAAVLEIANEPASHVPTLKKKRFYKCEKNGSYLIYGGTPESWLYLTEWLLRRGAQNIILTTETINNHINLKLSILKRNYSGTITMIKQDACSITNAKALIKETKQFAPIIDVFILATHEKCISSNRSVLQNIDAALSSVKSTARMICFIGNDGNKPFIRSNTLPVCNIAWENQYGVMDILKKIDIVIAKTESVSVTVKNEIIDVEIIEEKVATNEDSMFLPNDLRTMKLLGANVSGEPKLVKLVSATPMTHKETPPVFIVPGLSGPYSPELKKFARQLMHPVRCVDLQDVDLGKSCISNIAKQIIDFKKCAVYNLIGISWGGLLALEIAKELQDMGVRVLVLLIDGAPKTVQAFTNKFAKSNKFDQQLLKQLLTTDSSEDMKIILKSFESNGYTSTDYNHILNSLNVLKAQIEYSNSYVPLTSKISGDTILLRPAESNKEDTCGLIEHCMQINCKVMKGNHRTMLVDEKLIEFVNKMVALM